MSFTTLGLTAPLLKALHDKGYENSTPIQTQAIPVVLQGKDVMAAAQTGTGKTAAFTIPILQLLSDKPVGSLKKVRALILTPTRELAAQVGENVTLYGKYLSLTSAIVFGGVSIKPQIAALNRGVDILIATPGRLMDLVGQEALNLSSVEILVLDEADRMLDMGFIPAIRKILGWLPKKRQTLLFSATFSEEIRALAAQFLHSPVRVEVASPNSTAEKITQVIHPVDRVRKTELLSWMIGSQNWKQVLVFTRTKHGANRLSEQLIKNGLPSAAIHGNKSQGARTQALANFKAGKVRVLVATDIAARGLDIDKLPHVVNFDLPDVPEDYVHRIGRTGRAQQEGQAVSLVCIDELGLLRDIERVLKSKIPQVVIPGYEPDPSIKAEPIRRGLKMAPGTRPRPQGHAPRSRHTSGPKTPHGVNRNHTRNHRKDASR